MALFSKIVAFSFFLVSSLLSVQGDVYMHWPRGSNNRLNEGSATRNNDQRLFDSQNNNRGGYNVGERVTGTTGTNSVAADDPNFLNPNYPTVPSGTGEFQYQMVFFEDSVLPVEWTNQHACGGNEKDDPQITNCDIVIQYMCEADTGRVTTNGAPSEAGYFSKFTTPSSRYPIGSDDPVKDGANTNTGSGVHESSFWYDFCTTRSRNNGLFLADQGMNGNTARFTRQDNAGTRHGNECPEERDYYPYWTPTPWIDVAILTDYSDSRCTAGKYNGASQNTNKKGICDVNGQNTGQLDDYRPWSKELCDSKYPGKWVEWELNWSVAGLQAPDCLPAPWSRDNHLGNGRDGYMLSYNWTLPKISTLEALGMKIYRPGTGDANTLGQPGTTPTAYAKCVLRLRYNITTDEYDGDSVDGCYSGGNVNGNQNNNNQNLCSGSNKKESPFTPRRPNNNANTYFADIGGLGYDNTDANNPAPMGSLRLAIDTSQFGRTFEDRSHTFIIKQRPPAFNGRKIYNLGVRGKRCNIVQCYPAVEYDFIPYHLSIMQGDLIHVQWTGSNTHNNGGGGGDGQTGDSGQGTGGTDRHNMVEILDPSHNYPIPLDKFPNNIWSNSHCFSAFAFPLGGPFTGTSTSLDGYNADPSGSQWGDISKNRNQLECALYMATSGYYRSLTHLSQNLAQFQPTLNNAPPSLIGGVVMEIFKKAGQSSTTYHYMSTRNNAFTNRSQKAKITVY